MANLDVCGHIRGYIDIISTITWIEDDNLRDPCKITSHAQRLHSNTTVVIGDAVRLVLNIQIVVTSSVAILSHIQIQDVTIFSRNNRGWSPAPTDAAADGDSRDGDFQFGRRTGFIDEKAGFQSCQLKID